MKFIECCLNPKTTDEVERKPNSNLSDSGAVPIEEDFDLLLDGIDDIDFSYEELRYITNDFSDIIGHGGFGIVYKGVLNGVIVAVKRLSEHVTREEFQNELMVSRSLHHENLVEFLGYSNEGHGTLVFRYVPRGDLLGLMNGDLPLSWEQRLKIALGVASGLHYMNSEAGLLHRDIKASNVLIADDFTPKIADFGLTVNPPTLPEYIPHITGSRYWAPEYAVGRRVHQKTDMFSFGVLLLELVTGRSSFWSRDFVGVVPWFLSMWPDADGNGNSHVLADPRLQGNYDERQMRTMLGAAFFCVQDFQRHDPWARPVMADVLDMLQDILAPALDDVAIDDD